MPKKEKKSYVKPAYEVEDVFEKMSLACKAGSGPPNCKVSAPICHAPGLFGTSQPLDPGDSLALVAYRLNSAAAVVDHHRHWHITASVDD